MTDEARPPSPLGSDPEDADADLALVEALGIPGAPPAECECGHTWEWHRAPEMMGPCQYPIGYRTPLRIRLPFGLRPVWLRKLDGCPRYRPRRPS